MEKESTTYHHIEMSCGGVPFHLQFPGDHGEARELETPRTSKGSG
ncbi:hypothetical protein ACFLWS_03375 [Chloroflexota bacterium]